MQEEFQRAFGGGGKCLESSPQRGEEAIVHERLASVTSAGEGNIAAKSLEVDKSVSRWVDKSETEKVIICNSSNVHESIVGWGCDPNSETESFSVVDAMQEFSLLGRADCSLRAQEAHGGVEPAEHSVDPLNANNQAELEREVDSSFCYCENLPLTRISKFTTVH